MSKTNTPATRRLVVDVSTANEATAYPYWMVIDPVQMMKPEHHSVASMFSGPFFSRDAAECHLTAKRHRYGKHAVVYCCSGHMSMAWRHAHQAAEEGVE